MTEISSILDKAETLQLEAIFYKERYQEVAEEVDNLKKEINNLLILNASQQEKIKKLMDINGEQIKTIDILTEQLKQPQSLRRTI